MSWWRDGVVYQIYTRSFADADGDGLGDLAGITARLNYVAGLGVQAVWLTPFQRSPQADHGYDVSDYCDVDSRFGTLAGFDALVARGHALGLKLIVDLVPNHCSIEHPLFQAALAAGPGSAERARFHFASGRDPHGDEPPNNWPSVFGGPAWTRVVETDGTPGEWYLHLYAPEQPDWNWSDPRTAAFFDDVVRFWFDRGVDGLRIDVAHGLCKAAGLPDVADVGAIQPMRLRSNPLACDRAEVHAVHRRWRAIADRYQPPRALIGEVNLVPERAAHYLRPDELHQVFAFDFLIAPWDAAAWCSIGEELLGHAARQHAPVTWVVENHDVVRTPTRYGLDGGDGPARARAALLAVLGLPGAAYLFQGQELGLPDVDVAPEHRLDPAWRRSGISRDGCRVPLPWQRDPAGSYGFSPAGAAPSWLPVPPGWGERAVEVQEADGASPLHLCRTALQLRRRLHAEGVLGADDVVAWNVGADGALRARRGGRFTLVVAMAAAPVVLPLGQVLLTSGGLDAGGRLPADAAAWVLA